MLDVSPNIPLCELCPRLFALDYALNICVAAKMAGPLDTSFRRSVRGGVEQQEFLDLSSGDFSWERYSSLPIDDLGAIPAHSGARTRYCKFNYVADFLRAH
ncbi:hypothetical protein Tco_0887583 [Tanacetum coccineum]